jgi:hypothetical protein
MCSSLFKITDAGSWPQHVVVHPSQPAEAKQHGLTEALHAASALQAAVLVWSPQQSQQPFEGPEIVYKHV